MQSKTSLYLNCLKSKSLWLWNITHENFALNDWLKTEQNRNMEKECVWLNCINKLPNITHFNDDEANGRDLNEWRNTIQQGFWPKWTLLCSFHHFCQVIQSSSDFDNCAIVLPMSQSDCTSFQLQTLWLYRLRKILATHVHCGKLQPKWDDERLNR